MAFENGVDHAGGPSFAFVRDDGSSPIHRIVFEVDGTIDARLGSYRLGAWSVGTYMGISSIT